jgi:hypothetical protein
LAAALALASSDGLLFRPASALSRRNLGPSRSGHLPTPSRLEFSGGRSRGAASALHDLKCAASKIGELPDEGSELLLQLLVPVLCAASSEFKDGRRVLGHSR